MRECNRPDGPQLLLTKDELGRPRYEVPPERLSQFNLLSADVGPAEAPKRSRKLMQQTIDDMKNIFNTKAFDFVPYKWESFRSNPGK